MKKDQSFTIEKTIIVPACTEIQVKMIFKEGTASLPYKATFTYTDGTKEV